MAGTRGRPQRPCMAREVVNPFRCHTAILEEVGNDTERTTRQARALIDDCEPDGPGVRQQLRGEVFGYRDLSVRQLTCWAQGERRSSVETRGYQRCQRCADAAYPDHAGGLRMIELGCQDGLEVALRVE